MRTDAQQCTLMNQRTNAALCTNVRVAKTFFTRLVGLLNRSELPADHGLWIKPSNGIHTMGMRFAIDVVAFDKDGRVLKCVEHVQPWSVVGMPRKTRSVVELPAGHLSSHPVSVGDHAVPMYC